MLRDTARPSASRRLSSSSAQATHPLIRILDLVRSLALLDPPRAREFVARATGESDWTGVGVASDARLWPVLYAPSILCSSLSVLLGGALCLPFVPEDGWVLGGLFSLVVIAFPLVFYAYRHGRVTVASPTKIAICDPWSFREVRTSQIDVRKLDGAKPSQTGRRFTRLVWPDHTWTIDLRPPFQLR
jgi:hypothetical protein